MSDEMRVDFAAYQAMLRAGVGPVKSPGALAYDRRYPGCATAFWQLERKEQAEWERMAAEGPRR